MSTISSLALFSGKNIMSSPMSLKSSLFSGDRYAWLSIRATTRLVPSFLARSALTMFTLWFMLGFTAMKRSAPAQPASRSVPILEGWPWIVAMSAWEASSRIRPASASMTVMSLLSTASILARWAPVRPAPSMIIFMCPFFYLTKIKIKIVYFASPSGVVVLSVFKL